MNIVNVVLTGGQSASDGDLGDAAFGTPASALLFGDDNVLTGGDESFSVVGQTSGSTITLGNGVDWLSLAGDGNIVTLGAARMLSEKLTSGVGDVVVVAGQNNSLTVAGSVHADLIGSDNSMNFTDPTVLTPTGPLAASGSQPDAERVRVCITGSGDHITQTAGDTSLVDNQPHLKISGGSGSNYVDVQDSGSIALGGEHNTITVASGSYDIHAGSGSDYVVLGNTPGTGPDGSGLLGTETIHLEGTGNQVTGSGHATISGGAGNATLNMVGIAGSSYDVDLGGKNNIVNVGSGTASVDAGSGSDTVSLTDITGSVVFHGSNNMMFLNGDNSAAVADHSSGLRIDFDAGACLGSNNSHLTIASFDAKGVISFDAGVGGFTSVSQIMANLHSDGAGGMLLSSAAGAPDSTSVHFLGVSHLSASNFAIG